MYVCLHVCKRKKEQDVNSVMLTVKDSIASYPEQVAGDQQSWLKYLQSLKVGK